jgi:hypothetical protein
MKRILFYGLSLLAIIYILDGIKNHTIPSFSLAPSPEPRTGWYGAAPKQWFEVGRKTVLDESWMMPVSTGYSMAPLSAADPNIREKLQGTFVSGDPGVTLLVLDQEHWQQWMKGYPPLPLGQALPTARFNITIPDPSKGWFFAFYRRPPQTTAGGLPTSTAGLVLTLLRQYEDSHPAPTPMTAKIDLVIESFTTAELAAREREAVAR